MGGPPWDLKDLTADVALRDRGLIGGAGGERVPPSRNGLRCKACPGPGHR